MSENNREKSLKAVDLAETLQTWDLTFQIDWNKNTLFPITNTNHTDENTNLTILASYDSWCSKIYSRG